jgi:hypothetical protein
MKSQMERLRDLLVGGTMLYVAGLVVLFFAWPSGEGSGSVFWTLVAGAGASFGAGMALVAIIGYGVKFGREAVRLQ